VVSLQGRRRPGRAAGGGGRPALADAEPVGARDDAAVVGGTRVLQRRAQARARVRDLRGRGGVEPTNNAAERALRPAVLWRKGSFGADSEAGNGFVAKILTVAATCRQQPCDRLAYLTDPVAAHRRGQSAPPLLTAASVSAPLQIAGDVYSAFTFGNRIRNAAAP